MVVAEDNVVIDGLEKIKPAVGLQHRRRGITRALVLVRRDELDALGVQRLQGCVRVVVDSRVQNRAAEFWIEST
jgi:hypothetical protein